VSYGTGKLNLGSGIDALPGYTNVDAMLVPGVDVLHNLDVEPWPWNDRTITEIRAFDVFEHVNDPLLFMRECHRVMKPDGLLNLHTCYWKSKNAFTDPTHRRFCTEETFDYWIPGTYLHSRYGAAYASVGDNAAIFRKESLGLDGTELAIRLRRI
jgi:SAM-dependent methyltransferase